MTDGILDQQLDEDRVVEETSFVIRSNKVGRITAFASFVLGSLLVMLLVVLPTPQMLSDGIYFLVIAVGTNSIVFLAVLASYFQAYNKRRVFATMGIMLLNIPVVLGYLLFDVGITLILLVSSIN